MKIAVSATGPGPDSGVFPDGLRCPYFLVLDSADAAFQARENPHAGEPAAEAKAASFLAGLGITHCIAGPCGAAARQALASAGVVLNAGASGSARQAVDRFLARRPGVSQAEALASIGFPRVPPAPPLPRSSGGRGLGGGGRCGGGRGRGLGLGGGGGSGMGRGLGRGAAGGSGAAPVPVAARAQRPRARVAPELCTGCGSCVDACPLDAIRLVRVKAVVDGAACAGCGACAAQCPVQAISLVPAGLA